MSQKRRGLSLSEALTVREALGVWDLLHAHLITLQSHQHHIADSLQLPSLRKAMLSFIPISALFELTLLMSKNKWI